MDHTRHTALAHWHAHINRYAAAPQVLDWLKNRQSLTSRLVACCEQFQVQRLHQQSSQCLSDEVAVMNLSRHRKVMERDVLLRCNGVPVVYAHTILPRSANATQWPLFASLGNRSLGTTLFDDPLVARGALQFSLLHATHPLMQRIAKLDLLGTAASSLYARRSLFTRRGSSLLVTEVFLPALYALQGKRN
jgi:chorismate--pyruvate lyase